VHANAVSHSARATLTSPRDAIATAVARADDELTVRHWTFFFLRTLPQNVAQPRIRPSDWFDENLDSNFPPTPFKVVADWIEQLRADRPTGKADRRWPG
jgi:hypothetical protein